MWGDDDRLIPPAYGERLAELIPNARLEVIENCGHVIWFEKPDELLELALEHLGAVRA